MNYPTQLSKEAAILQLIRQVLQFEHLLESGFVQSMAQSVEAQTQRNVVDLSTEVENLRLVSTSLQQQIDSMSQMIEMVTSYYEQTDSRFDLINGRLVEMGGNTAAMPQAGGLAIADSYLVKIRQTIFSSEAKLRASIANSFYINAPTSKDIGSFLGVYEKAGLTYIALTDLKAPTPRLPLAMAVSSLLDKVILGSRLADSTEILQNIDSLLSSFVEDTQQLFIGLFVMEKLSMVMTYHSTKIPLFHGVRGVVQEVKPNLQSPMPFGYSHDRQHIDKGSMFRGENAYFYIANEAVFSLLGNGQREVGVEAFRQLLGTVQQLGLSEQRTAIEQHLYKQPASQLLEDIQVLGFQF